MALRNIVTGTDNETLRTTAREVKNITKHILTLLDDLNETLDIEEGVGIAAPQVGVLRRIAIVKYDDQLYELINPVILESTGGVIGEEGCLSVVGTRGTVKRPDYIKVRYTDRDGNEQIKEIRDAVARVFCHEIDHLDGILFVDKMIEEVE